MTEPGPDWHRGITEQILGAEQDERRRIALFLHDGPVQSLSGVALMLDAVGAERDAVIADYASSQDNLAGPWADGMIQMVTSFGLPITPELSALITGTPPAAMQAALEWTDAGFGGAAGYLQSGGLTGDELAALRARLRA